jgi:hypothetical protein
MSGFEKGQALADIRWGSGMPVTVVIESNICEFRARGKCSVQIEAAQNWRRMNSNRMRRARSCGRM